MKKISLNMNKVKLAIVGSMLMFGSFSAFSETPTRGFNYQAIARDASGNPMASKNITVELSVISGSENGRIVWQESHVTTTNEFGLFALVIGEGTATGTGTVSAMKDVDWSNNDYYIQVKADFGNGGFMDMGTSKLQAVPYSLKADSALSAPRYPISQSPDVNVTNLVPGMTLAWNGTQWVATDLRIKNAADSAVLNSQIDAETAARINADNALETKINNNTTALMSQTYKNTTDILQLKSLGAGKIYIGDDNNTVSQVAVTGDATISNTGEMVIGDNTVTNRKISTGIDASKLGDGSISNSELQNLDGSTGNVQTQINNTQAGLVSTNADVTNIKTNLQTINGTTTSLQSQITTNTTDIVSIKSDVLNNATSITNINDDIAGMNGTVANMQIDIETNATNISDNTSAINNINSDITNLNGTVSDMELSISNHATSITENTTAIADLSTGLKAANSTIASIEGQLTEHTSSISNLQNDLTTLNSSVADVQTQVTDNNTANASAHAIYDNALVALQTLASGKLYVGNEMDKMTEVSLNGDVTMNSEGTVTIADNAITKDKLANGSVTTQKISAQGEATEETFLRGDGTWSTVKTTIPSDLELNSLYSTTINSSSLNGSELTIGSSSNPSFIVNAFGLTANSSIKVRGEVSSSGFKIKGMGGSDAFSVDNTGKVSATSFSISSGTIEPFSVNSNGDVNTYGSINGSSFNIMGSSSSPSPNMGYAFSATSGGDVTAGNSVTTPNLNTGKDVEFIKSVEVGMYGGSSSNYIYLPEQYPNAIFLVMKNSDLSPVMVDLGMQESYLIGPYQTVIFQKQMVNGMPKFNVVSYTNPW